MNEHEAELLRLLNKATGIETDDGARTYDADDDLTDEERQLAAALDRYMAKPPSPDEQAAAAKRARRDYTGGLEGDDVSVALAYDRHYDWAGTGRR